MIQRPELLRKVDKRLSVPPSVLEKAFLEANPGLTVIPEPASVLLLVVGTLLLGWGRPGSRAV